MIFAENCTGFLFTPLEWCFSPLIRERLMKR